MEKTLSKALLTVYIIMLIWLVLFKLQFDISHIVNRHHRSVNLTPFLYAVKREILLNWLFFIPFGVLLNVVYKRTGFIAKFLIILAFSLTAEVIQYIFAIGVTDITDLISNSLGGLAGLILYMLFNTFIEDRKLDRFVVTVGIILFLIFIFIHGSHYFRRTLFR
ncbi:VanZ family protein [Daejeonella sp.]|uniref:VanZ family protein n=1 Tax=Daejeonella sp. TaxID=2805397 RepID=UPI0030BCADC5